jgi:hypothetical protein
MRAGIIQRSPAGTGEVIYSNVSVAEEGSGCGLGRGAVLAGSPGSEIEENDGSQPSLFFIPHPHDPGKTGCLSADAQIK